MNAEASVKSSDLLYLSVSLRQVDNALGVILIYPGLNEYKERYAGLINYLNQSRMNVVIFDPRSQGKSINKDNELGVINEAQSLISDFKVMLKYTQGRYPNLNVYVLADSLGALVAINAIDNNEIIKKIALVSPLYMDNVDSNLKMLKFMLKMVGKKGENPTFQNILGFGTKARLFNNKDEFERLKADNLWYYNYKNISIYQMLRLESNVKSMKYVDNMEVLLIGGSLDTTLSSRSNLEILKNQLNKNGLSKVTLQEYDNIGHKVLFDIGCALCWSDILKFFVS